jgi:peptidoglycan/xylan/chitin deacetylase (PgdA/CDA1 family)/glycosyltransferase involved in cell wall biosynthesis
MLSSHGANARLTILLFHKIPHSADPLTPDDPVLAHFERTLDFLYGNANVIPLSEAVMALEQDRLPRSAVAITFDDGYDDWLHTVGPALRRRNLPATFFITTEQLDGPALWHERIVAAVRALPNIDAALPYAFGTYGNLSSPQRRIRLIAELQERLKYAPLAERLAAIEMLESQAVSRLVLPKRFGREAVRELHNQGFEIGGHTITHPILNECTDAQAMEEIGGCKEELEAIIGGRVHSFAYPNGRPVKDYQARHVTMVKACGYRTAVATSGGAAKRSSDPFQLPRFTPWGLTERRIALQLTRNLLARERHIPLGKERQAPESGTSVRCLLITSNFSPVQAAPAVVYENLCRHMPSGSMRVLSASTSYLDNREISGWKKHDESAPYPIDRIRLLRPLKLAPPANLFASIWRFLFNDIAVYVNALVSASRIVRSHRINVVCVGELVYGSWLGIALRKIFRCKFVIYTHGEEIASPDSGRLHESRRRNYLHAADKVIAVNSIVCDALSKDLGLSQDKIVLIETGVDEDGVSTARGNAELEQRHGLQGSKLVFTVVGTKGLDASLHAIVDLVRERNNVHCLIAVDGRTCAQLQDLIERERLNGRVTLLDQLEEEELIRHLRRCDIVLMPNWTAPDAAAERDGLIFREANALGKPVLRGAADSAETIRSALRHLSSDVPPVASDLAPAESQDRKSMARTFRTVCERLLRESSKRG